MNDYDVRFYKADGTITEVLIRETTQAKAIVKWRERFPAGRMIYVKDRHARLEPDRRLPREPD